MRVNCDVAMEVAAHEALVSQTYKDSAGVLTWCVGMTNATGHRVERYIREPQSVQHCMDIYVWALTNYAEQVREVFKDHPLTMRSSPRRFRSTGIRAPSSGRRGQALQGWRYCARA
ncbi:hypothetical protein [Chelativorans sp. YIM 93263]|uniref:hypothetical protein n=1 Tax=Chelativorans sp. YIM 93263 TaxID=2906648 RepID=UPI002378DBA8|nr:hypothetical protein [Chelativorans sp. YIM 93263]